MLEIKLYKFPLFLGAIEEGWRQKQRQKSLRLFGGQN